MSIAGILIGLFACGHIPYFSQLNVQTMLRVMTPQDSLLIHSPGFYHALALINSSLFLEVLSVAFLWDLLFDGVIAPPLRFRVRRWQRDRARQRRASLRLKAGS